MAFTRRLNRIRGFHRLSCAGKGDLWALASFLRFGFS
jgi:hypothetical protein